MKHTT